VRRGLVRSFQITAICHRLTALENVILAVQATSGHCFRFWRPALDDHALTGPATAMLDRVGLGHAAERPAGQLAHGEQRQLEVAMALAAQPRLLLLDEPMAGMGPEESARMADLLATLKGRHTILLIEHDMDAVFRLADRVSVLVSGRCIASGSPAAIRADDAVRTAYLGEEGHDA
jgi:branched-chain amino acid transport system ATP-binding protein